MEDSIDLIIRSGLGTDILVAKPRSWAVNSVIGEFDKIAHNIIFLSANRSLRVPKSAA